MGALTPANAINATIAVFRMPMIFPSSQWSRPNIGRTSWSVVPNQRYRGINGWLTPDEIVKSSPRRAIVPRATGYLPSVISIGTLSNVLMP
jgi:hypothetical protein